MTEIEKIESAIMDVKSRSYRTEDGDNAVRWLTELIEYKKAESEKKLAELDRLCQAVEKASELNTYKVSGNHDTYSQYNEGWQACVGFIDGYEVEGLK